MSDRFVVYVLAEGKRDQRFIRKFLQGIGVGPREMTFAPISDGRGSGKQSVLQSFADEVRAYRRRNSHTATSLVVMMDADNQSVDRCLSDLDRKLVESGQERVDRCSDRIARLIPRRNIETWILYLVSGALARTQIREDDKGLKDTKSADAWDDAAPIAAAAFCEWYRFPSQRPAALLDSLDRGLRELPAAFPAKE